MMLNVENLQVFYGAIHALQGVSFHLEKGEIVALIGANGAGKSTVLNTISGILHPREGSVCFDGQDIQQTPPQNIVRRGVIQIPEGRKVFSRMTVAENLAMGAYTQSDRATIERDMDAVFKRFPRLKDRRN